MSDSFIEIIKTLEHVKSKRIVVVGDILLDEYVYGAVERVSTGIKIPVIQKKKSVLRLGGAGNVAANVAGLSDQTFLLGRYGNDDAGKRVAALCEEKGIDICDYSVDKTSVKQRIYVDNQQMVRLDSDYCMNPIEEEIISFLRKVSPDVIIISDYLLGVVTKNTIEYIKKFVEFKDSCQIYLTSRDLSKFDTLDGMNIVLNASEYKEYEDKSRNIGSELFENNNVFITKGEYGIEYLYKKNHIEKSTRKCHAVNVSGAGDTIIAILAMLSGEVIGLEQIIEIANIAGGKAVEDELTHAIDKNELICAIYESLVDKNSENKVVTKQLAKVICESWKNTGDRIVLTNGCYDLLHLGHIKSFQYSKQFGEKLIVAVNSNSSIKRLKGKGRPINSLEERVSNLAYLEMVDMVIPFDDDTAIDVIKDILPDIYVKGEEYKTKYLPEAQFVPRIEYVPMVEGTSTTTLIDRVLEAYENERRD